MTDVKLNSEQQKLVADNINLARYFAKKAPEHMRADAESEAFIALCKAAYFYDSTKGKFSTFAGISIKWSIANMLRKERAHDSFVLEVDVRTGEVDNKRRIRNSYFMTPDSKGHNDDSGCSEATPAYQSFISPEEWVLREEAITNVKKARKSARKALLKKFREPNKYSRSLGDIERHFSDPKESEVHPREKLGVSKQRVSQIWLKYKSELQERLVDYGEYVSVPSPNYLEA